MKMPALNFAIHLNYGDFNIAEIVALLQEGERWP